MRHSWCWLIGLCVVPRVSAAWALPAFVAQTGQPCAACHAGAFGLQLTPYGRDFKINGDLPRQGSGYRLPIVVTGWTETDTDQPAAAAPNHNFALGRASISYAGKITNNFDAFTWLAHGIGRPLRTDDADVRYANGDGELFGQDMVWTIDARNRSAVSDEWSSVPAWGFPDNAGRLGVSLAANAMPNAFRFGSLDPYTDVAAYARYQFVANPNSVASDMLSADATFIDETVARDADADLLAIDPNRVLKEFRAAASYRFNATWTPTIQYFQVYGTYDQIAWGIPADAPNSAGYVAELAYAPWQKAGSPFSWGNLRLAVQYVGYLRAGGSSHAVDTNDVYFSVWSAAHF